MRFGSSTLRPGFDLWTSLTVFYSVYLCSTLDFDDRTLLLWTPALFFGLRFSTMASEKKCCVPNCGSEKEILHKFPNPIKDPERFRTWIYNIGGDILSLENDIIFKRRRVCHLHFEAHYLTRSKFLSANAVPRLGLPGPFARRPPLLDLTNQEHNIIPAEILPPLASTSRSSNPSIPPQESEQTVSMRKSNITKQLVVSKNEQNLAKQINKLKAKNFSYKMRLQKALKLSTNITFQTALKKFKTLAALFTVMQFREISKSKMGRRFTKEEKIMALSVYKMGPKAYRWLSKIFVLPSPITLSRMVSRASLKPGINVNVFNQLKKKIGKMNEDHKLCTLIFDEMALSPHMEFNPKKDRVSGFVNHNGESSRKIADHVLVFMIRGIMKNYKQPIYYSFCSGSTPKQILAAQIKTIIKQLHLIGFTVLATVCDQGTSNTSAINYLIEETRGNYLRKNEEFSKSIFEIDGKEIIPLYDIPHLLKGMRNNLMNKNLKLTLEGEVKIAKWEHIMLLYENNPTYKGLKMIKNLTENHCNKEKIPKMKVKYASQLFSQTVGKTMGYLAENGILPEETKHTADFIIFMDNLFDSLNGSMKNSNVRSGKELLRNVTPKSQHHIIWKQAKIVLNSMTFVTSKGSASVPSIRNWVKTVDNMLILREKLFNDYKIKSFWCRHLNQDPIENFFGSIRSHGVRNTSPTCAGFEAAFASLLINNMSSNYSPGSNCEEDFCSVLASFDELIFSSKNNEEKKISQIEFEDINDIIITNFEIKKQDPRKIAQLEYVTGYILRKTKKIFKNCKTCNLNLYTHDPDKNKYLECREYKKGKKYLCYPSENLIKCFSEIQDVLHHILRKRSHIENLKNYMKTILYINVNTQFLVCSSHSNDIREYMFDFSSRFFAYNWCKWTNKLLNGISTTKDVDPNDDIQNQASEYYLKRRRSVRPK